MWFIPIHISLVCYFICYILICTQLMTSTPGTWYCMSTRSTCALLSNDSKLMILFNILTFACMYKSVHYFDSTFLALSHFPAHICGIFLEHILRGIMENVFWTIGGSTLTFWLLTQVILILMTSQTVWANDKPRSKSIERFSLYIFLAWKFS